MVVSENGAHLAGREIEDGSASWVIDIGSLASIDEERTELRSVSDHAVVDQLRQIVGRFRIRFFRQLCSSIVSTPNRKRPAPVLPLKDCRVMQIESDRRDGVGSFLVP